jgi:hypothetical protein
VPRVLDEWHMPSGELLVKVRVAQVGKPWGKKAAQLHLRYLERGVRRHGAPGRLYGEHRPMERNSFEKELRREAPIPHRAFRRSTRSTSKSTSSGRYA